MSITEPNIPADTITARTMSPPTQFHHHPSNFYHVSYTIPSQHHKFPIPFHSALEVSHPIPSPHTEVSIPSHYHPRAIRVVVLREHHFQIFESLRRSLWPRRNARLGFENIKSNCGGECRCALLLTASTPSGKMCSRWQTPPCLRSPTAAGSHERCRSATQVAHGSFFPPRRHPQAQPLEPASRNFPNGCQKHGETSGPHTRPSGATKRLRWPPGPVHCSTQPPARVTMLPPRSIDSTRLAWSGVEFPPSAPPAALERARQPLC